MKLLKLLLTFVLINREFCSSNVITPANTINDDGEVVTKSSTEPNDPTLNMGETTDIPDYEIVDGDILLYDYGEDVDVLYDATSDPSRLWPKVGRYIVFYVSFVSSKLHFVKNNR